MHELSSTVMWLCGIVGIMLLFVPGGAQCGVGLLFIAAVFLLLTLAEIFINRT